MYIAHCIHNLVGAHSYVTMYSAVDKDLRVETSCLHHIELLLHILL